jgi:plastocyanin
MTRRLVVVAVAALALPAACSNREPAVTKRPHSGTATASTVGNVQQITITTGVDLRFHPSTFVVHSGRVRLTLKNVPTEGGGPPHDINFSGLPAGNVPLTTSGESQSVSFEAPSPGTYNFVCTIHAAQGQTGKMIVK